MGIITPTDGWDGLEFSKINEQQESTKEKIWEVLEQEKNNVNRLEAIWITINWKDKEKINGMDLADTEIENLRRIKKTWIFIYSEDIEDIKDIILTDTEIENVKKIKKIWGILVNSKDIKEVKEIEVTEIDLRNIEKLKFLIRNYRDIKNVKGLNDNEIENIIKIYEMWILISRNDIKYIKDLTNREIENIKAIKELWIHIRTEDIEEIKDISNNDLKHIEELKGIIWYSFEIKYIKWLTEKETKNIKNIIQQWIQTNAEDIKTIKNVELTNKEIEITKDLNKEWAKLGVNELKIIRENQEILENPSKNKYEWHEYTPEQIEMHEYYTKWTIVENIQQYIQNIIKENRDIETHEIIKAINEDLQTISQSERLWIMTKIYTIVDKFNTVRKYLDFKNWPYKTPKELLCAAKWITDSNTISEISDNITIKQHWVGFAFYIWDKKTFKIIHDHDSKLNPWKNLPWWYYSTYSKIQELEGTISIINSDVNNHRLERVTRHEGQHNWDTYFNPDTVWAFWTDIPNAKEEIIANLRENIQDFWEWIEYSIAWFESDCRLYQEIEQSLNADESEWWIYIRYEKPKAQENQKNETKKMIKYAIDIISLTKHPESWLKFNNVISMLAITPADKRDKLHKTIIETNKSIIQQIKEEDEDDGVVL